AGAVASGGTYTGGHLARLARSLDAQSDELLRIARETLRTDPLSQQLEREVRAFTAAADRFRRAAEANPPLDQLRGAFDPVGRSWAVVTQTLTARPVLWDATALRQQTVQVGSLVDLLARAVGVTVAPPAPVPA